MAENMTKRFTCEICGSTELLKTEGAFVCQSCGCKYSAEEVRKLMGITESAPANPEECPTPDTAAVTEKKRRLSNKKGLIILGILVGAFLVNALISGGQKAASPEPVTQTTAPQALQRDSSSTREAYQLNLTQSLPTAITYTTANNAAMFYVKDVSYTSSEAFGMSKLTIEVTVGDAEISWLRNDDPKYDEFRPYVAFWAEFCDASGNVIAKSCFTPTLTVGGPDLTVTDTLFSTFIPQGTYNVVFRSAR